MRDDQPRALTLRISQPTIIFAIAIATALLVYAQEIGNFSLSIDEEVHRFHPEMWQTWIAQGRWAMGILAYVVPHGISSMPFLAIMLFAAGLSLSAVLLSTIFAPRRDAAIAFVIIFVSSPIWLHIAEFNTLSWGFAVGLTLVALALRRLNAAHTRSSVWAGVFLGVALGIYQSFLIFYLAAALALLMRAEWRGHAGESGQTQSGSLLRIAYVMGSTAIAVLIYIAAGRLLMQLAAVDGTYVEQYINLSLYRTDGRNIIARVLQIAAGLVFGSDPTFLGLGPGSLLLSWVGALLMVRYLFRRTPGFGAKAYATTLAIGVLLVSISLIVVSAGYIPTRALIAFPLLYGALAAVPFDLFRRRRVLWILLLVALFCNTYISTALFYADRIAREQDMIMATRLIDRIEAVGRTKFGDHIPLAVVGTWQHPAVGPTRRVEMFGISFFEQDGGNPYRIAYYLTIMGCPGLSGVAITDIRGQLPEIASRPAWPADSSVFRTDNEVIVKLSEVSYHQRLLLQKP